MGVELRSIQRKFHNLMGEVKPQIRPRFVVWLDERLAEFKVKGCMELCETLEDPQWIKDYVTSKRESKVAAIKQRKDRSAASTSSTNVQPKLEQKSESSNGNAHPDELSEISKDDKTELTEKTQLETERKADKVKDPGYKLVEVKQEQTEEDDDDDMIIVGESIAPPSQFNPMTQLHAGFGGRTVGPFQRKRQRFGAIPHRALKTSRFKPNFRPAATVTSQPAFPSNTATSESFFVPASSSYQSHSQSFDEPYSSQSFDTGSYSGSGNVSYQDETLRIPPHLQSQASALQLQQQSGYDVTDEQIYTESYADETYGDESYDSSYMEGESSIVYDEEGNAVIKGENPGDDSSMEPVAGTSQDLAIYKPYKYSIYTKPTKVTSQNEQTHGLGIVKQDLPRRYGCESCARAFTYRKDLLRHVNSIHLKLNLFECMCGRKFTRKDSYVQHTRLQRCQYSIDSNININ